LNLNTLPAEFLRDNADNPGWLAALPERVDELAQRWSLRLDAHFPHIRLNFVAPATRADGTRCVFKLSRHVGETRNEIAALRLWQGHAAAGLLDADPEVGALLTERIEPGTMLTEIATHDDDAATRIAADLLRQLWQPSPATNSELRPLQSWCAAYDRNRASILSGDTGFPVALFQRADALRLDLLTSTPEPTALHGDFHPFNILQNQRGDWLSIDPKGLVGDRCFDVCQFLRNPIPTRVPLSVNQRRLDIFCSELDLDRARTRDWCLVHAVLDACWDLEDGNPWQSAIAYAEQTRGY
jgi:streptomycin 6-kinase